MKLHVGDIVRVIPSFLGNPENTLGFVYEIYTDFDDATKNGVSIILENGCDLGGFSFEEQQRYLSFVRKSGLHYDFKNVTKLVDDFQSKIKPAF